MPGSPRFEVSGAAAGTHLLEQAGNGALSAEFDFVTKTDGMGGGFIRPVSMSRVFRHKGRLGNKAPPDPI